MKSTVAKIAVWMPVYNEIANIESTIKSVLAQSFKDFIFYISDNHSNDGTREKIIEYSSKDERIIFTSPPLHCSSAEHGQYLYTAILDNISTEYLILIGGHDLWAVNLLETLHIRAESEPRASIVYTDAYEIDQSNKILKKWNNIIQTREIIKPNVINHVLLGLTHNIIMFGLWRTSFRKGITVRHPCTGADHFIVTEMALAGDILYEKGSAVYLRQPNNHKDGFTGYKKRHIPEKLHGELYKDFLMQLEWVSYICDKATSEPGFYNQKSIKNLLKCSVLSGFLCRYWPNLYHFSKEGFHSFFAHPRVVDFIKGCEFSTSQIEMILKDNNIVQ